MVHRNAPQGAVPQEMSPYGHMRVGPFEAHERSSHDKNDLEPMTLIFSDTDSSKKFGRASKHRAGLTEKMQIAMRDALSVWENEGGAQGWSESADAPSRTAPNGDDILAHLGGAVVAHWDELPQHFKQALFRELSAIEPSQKSLKERIARYLHVNGGPKLIEYGPITARGRAGPRRVTD